MNVTIEQSGVKTDNPIFMIDPRDNMVVMVLGTSEDYKNNYDVIIISCGKNEGIITKFGWYTGKRHSFDKSAFIPFHGKIIIEV